MDRVASEPSVEREAEVSHILKYWIKFVWSVYDYYFKT